MKQIVPLGLALLYFSACTNEPPATTDAVTTPREVVEIQKRESGMREDAMKDALPPAERPPAKSGSDAEQTMERKVELMEAEFTYAADAAVFKYCADGERYNLLQNSGYQALEKAYLDAEPEPMQAALVQVTGFKAPHLKLDKENDRPTMVILSVSKVLPGRRCR